MSGPRTSLISIVLLGVACVFILLLMMCVSLSTLEHTPAGTRAKIANAVSERYKKEDLTVEFRPLGAFNALQVSYVTREHIEKEAAEDEMRRIAEFVRAESLRYKDEPIRKMRQVVVKRTELFGSGCFQSNYESSITLDVPERPVEEKLR